MKNLKVSKQMLLMAILFMVTSCLYAQKGAMVLNTENHTINSKVLSEDRVISVYLPENYQSSTNEYPVIYLLDGKSHFQHAIGAVGFLARQGQIPQSIIVAIHNVDRNRDFSPVHVDKIPTSGGADKFLNFVSDELSTFIQKKYRSSDFTVLVGHSFGGTFAVYTLLTKPELFDGYVAISPALHYADNYLVNQAKIELKTSYAGKKQFFMTVGNEPNYFEPLQEFASLIKEKSSKSLNFEYKKMMDEDHGSIPYLSLYKGVQFVFADWKLPEDTFLAGLESIDKHYEQVSQAYGMKITAPELILNKLGYYYLMENDIANAIVIFKENTQRYSQSANVYDSLGEAYENNGQDELAVENYKKACELGEKEGNNNLPVYKKNFERVNQKLSVHNK